MQRWIALLSLALMMTAFGMSASAQSCSNLTNASSPSELIECVAALEVRLATQIPAGVVLAFDRPQGCPAGWEDMGRDWQGRAIVAAGGNMNDKYRFRQTGGKESHTLSLGEMPSHDHSIGILTWNDSLANGSQNVQVYVGSLGDLAGRSRAGSVQVTTTSAGSGSPHNNMPPYIALYMCKKS